MTGGRVRNQPEASPVWVAREISAGVDRCDVEQARPRAAAFRRAGYRTIPPAAGEEVTRGGEETARASRTLLLQDGRPEALAAALAGWPAGGYFWHLAGALSRKPAFRAGTADRRLKNRK